MLEFICVCIYICYISVYVFIYIIEFVYKYMERGGGVRDGEVNNKGWVNSFGFYCFLE